MRNKFAPSRFYRVAMLAMAAAIFTRAAPTEQMHWRELATYLRGKVVTITTKDGKSFGGRNVTVWPDFVAINDGVQIKVPRDTVVSFHWEAPYEGQTRKLGRLLSTSYRHAGKLLGTPAGPVAVVELPAITAWGAAAVPFCLLGDLFNQHPRTSGDISILPDGVSK
jgi:hypothetical protein